MTGKTPRALPIRLRIVGESKTKIVFTHEEIANHLRAANDGDERITEFEVYYGPHPAIFGHRFKSLMLSQLLARIVPRRFVEYTVRFSGGVVAHVDRLPYVRFPRRVVCAANLYNYTVGGEKRTKLVVGARHMDSVMRPQITELFETADSTAELHEARQGFIDQHGTFMTRAEAYDLALHGDQIFHKGNWPSGKLYSENLY